MTASGRTSKRLLPAFGHDEDDLDPFYLTTLDIFSALVAREPDDIVFDDRGKPTGDPKHAVVTEAAYGVELIKFKIREAVALMSKGQRTVAKQQRLRSATDALGRVAAALRPLYESLAPMDTWSDNARPAELIEMWMIFLKQVKDATKLRASNRKPTEAEVRAEVQRRLEEYGGNIVLPQTAGKVLQAKEPLERSAAFEAVLQFCREEPTRLARKEAALQIVGKTLGRSRKSVRIARVEHRKESRNLTAK